MNTPNTEFSILTPDLFLPFTTSVNTTGIHVVSKEWNHLCKCHVEFISKFCQRTLKVYSESDHFHISTVTSIVQVIVFSLSRSLQQPPLTGLLASVPCLSASQWCVAAILCWLVRANHVYIFPSSCSMTLCW